MLFQLLLGNLKLWPQWALWPAWPYWEAVDPLKWDLHFSQQPHVLQLVLHALEQASTPFDDHSGWHHMLAPPS